MSVLPMDALTLDAELQPRESIDRSVLENYVQLLVDGVQFPPVVAFRDGNVLWLSDGFHRWHSRKVLELDDIDVDVRDGTRRDALLYSLSANARHGLQRGDTDYRRAYEIACRNELVDSADSEGVARLLQCSGSWADKLTLKAREAAKARRDAEIIRLKDEGKSKREIARETDTPPTTVQRIISGPKEHSAGSDHHPFLTERAKDKLRELDSPRARAWSDALAALQLINEQVSVDALFGERFTGFDHAFWPALEAAHEWINELHGRFVNGGDVERRRA